MTRAFTLVELLVVISIVVVLLALLTPAMDQAIYQAELAVCAAQQRGIATSAQGYAFDSRRSYPYRPGVRDVNVNMQSFSLHDVAQRADERPVHRSYLNINKFLNDPLGPGEVDLEETDPDTWVNGNYSLWYGWYYHPNGQGMPGLFKVGDRFEWEGRRYSVMVADVDRPSNGDVTIGSHPDADGVLGPHVLQDQSGIANIGPVGVVKQTIAVWLAGRPDRGPIDMNTAFEDGAVLRYDDIEWNEWADNGEIRKVPEFSGVHGYGENRYINHLPAR